MKFDRRNRQSVLVAHYSPTKPKRVGQPRFIDSQSCVICDPPYGSVTLVAFYQARQTHSTSMYIRCWKLVRVRHNSTTNTPTMNNWNLRRKFLDLYTHLPLDSHFSVQLSIPIFYRTSGSSERWKWDMDVLPLNGTRLLRVINWVSLFSMRLSEKTFLFFLFFVFLFHEFWFLSGLRWRERERERKCVPLCINMYLRRVSF